MKQPRKILVFQTAFLGDVVLTLPFAQVLHREFPEAQIDFVSTPRASAILRNHPAIHSVLEYDKRGKERGLHGILSIARRIAARRYDVGLVLHRSLRSAAAVWLSRVPVRIGFSTSAGRSLYTDIVPYEKSHHEIERNLAFLKKLGIEFRGKELPSLFPSESDAATVDRYLRENGIGGSGPVVAFAPGSVWNTKRWPSDRYARLMKKLSERGMDVVLLGGAEDERLCAGIKEASGVKNGRVTAGKFSVLQSAELIRRCRALVTNDSAPMHLAVAMRTPVVAIFGATVPSFGFAPSGERDVVVEIGGLECRPCSIHGGDECPIKTFDCMMRIGVDEVFEKVMRL